MAAVGARERLARRLRDRCAICIACNWAAFLAPEAMLHVVYNACQDVGRSRGVAVPHNAGLRTHERADRYAPRPLTGVVRCDRFGGAASRARGQIRPKHHRGNPGGGRRFPAAATTGRDWPGAPTVEPAPVDGGAG
jgi:hypothetical protein